MGTMIRCDHLTKRYAQHLAVDDVSFEVSPGSVTGFLGPNGAGKSTCMRMICGLAPPTSGTATIAGKAYQELVNPARYVGTLLDAGAQHDGRTGREVLRVSAGVMGLPSHRVDELLELVGLSGQEGRRRVGGYSLGMRQRLGIAHALLGDPEVLVLDEPANGLDPGGIRWMRSVLREFADRGGTVLLSSHLLHEVDVIADRLVVIGRGRVVAQGPRDELLAGAGTFVSSEDDVRLGAALTTAGVRVSTADRGLVAEADARSVSTVAMDQQILLTELRPDENASLEQFFLQLTESDAREAVPHER